MHGQYFSRFGTDKEVTGGFVFETLLERGNDGISVNHLRASGLTRVIGKNQMKII